MNRNDICKIGGEGISSSYNERTCNVQAPTSHMQQESEATKTGIGESGESARSKPRSLRYSRVSF